MNKDKEGFIEKFGKLYIGHSRSDSMVAEMRNNQLKEHLLRIYEWIEEKKKKWEKRAVKEVVEGIKKDDYYEGFNGGCGCCSMGGTLSDESALYDVVEVQKYLGKYKTK